MIHFNQIMYKAVTSPTTEEAVENIDLLLDLSKDKIKELISADDIKQLVKENTKEVIKIAKEEIEK